MDILGIDVGGVIIDRANDKTDTSFFGEKYLETTPVDGAFEAIARLHADLFKGKVYVVSKCGQKIQKQTLHWMEHRGFFQVTGIPRERVLFCRRRQDKYPIARRLKLTHFIDDRLEILAYLKGAVKTRILFQGRPDEKKLTGTLAKQAEGVVRAESWGDVLDALGAIPPEDKICSCERDADGRCQTCIEKASRFVEKLVQFQKDVKRTLDRIIGELTHVCRACDRKYYDFALAKVVRDYFSEAKENWKAELPLMQEVIQMYIGVGRGVGITQYPLTEKAWKELESRDDH